MGKHWSHVIKTPNERQPRIGPTNTQRRIILRSLYALSTIDRKLTLRLNHCGLCEIIDSNTVILYATSNCKKLAAMLELAALHGDLPDWLEITKSAPPQTKSRDLLANIVELAAKHPEYSI
jgi:hypothetical protein